MPAAVNLPAAGALSGQSAQEIPMRVIRLAVPILALALAATPARAAEEAADWALTGRLLTLVHAFVRLAAESPDPQAMQKGVDAMLAGENAEVNRAAAGLLDEMLAEMPPEQRILFMAIGRDALKIARREQARAASLPDPEAQSRALQARKDLHAMGLRYHDAGQFLEAVRRDDALAVELYVLARGVNLSARDADGRSALEIAQRAGNRQLAAILSAAGAR
jgi:hypothetical protein